MFQGHAIQKFHGDERVTTFLSDIVNGADVGMVQRGCSLGFSLETAEGLGIAGNFIGQKLQSYEAMQASVFGLVDDTHSTAAEFLDDAVVRDSSADHCKKWYVRNTGKSTKAAEGDLKRAKISRRENFSPLCWSEDFSNFQFAGRVSNPNEYLSGTPL